MITLSPICETPLGLRHPRGAQESDVEMLRSVGLAAWSWSRDQVCALAGGLGWSSVLRAAGHDPASAVERWYEGGGLVVYVLPPSQGCS